ncbi:methyltransferase C-terminal domain-containing protein [Pseudonocardia endophytica]|uniref:Putative zinc binding protein n=1 Tax=Pseudonocardia endophytica TaxID=401976 RepID=A0A4R1HGS6_PSEEN|nr:methyltransferase C-terminal domain-containing protein [Pseudonocardia endophytica]TCK20918.1 putative zinc binding protein [Pseudonocardia endophytica]
METTEIRCRFCRSSEGELVLDAGRQPAAKVFPDVDDTTPEDLYPLRMWMCGQCHLAQLVEDPGTPEEPVGLEPAALVEQGRDAVSKLVEAGILGDGTVYHEYPSPHGGNWGALLEAVGARPAEDGELADVCIDNLGLIHDADQASALAERATRIREDGILLFQWPSLQGILDTGSWNALRHGHFAYQSVPVMVAELAEIGFGATTAWWFPLYGGSVLLAAQRGGQPDQELLDLIAREESIGVLKSDVVRDLQRSADATSSGLREFIVAEREAGRNVWGYGAASRCVALLNRAEIGPDLLPTIADGGGAKQGKRTPGSGIPIVAPSDMIAAKPDTVLLFLGDMLNEMRGAMPEIERNGGRWVIADDLG